MINTDGLTGITWFCKRF